MLNHHLWTRLNVMNHHGAKHQCHDCITWNSQTQGGNKGRDCCRAVGRLGRGHALNGPLAKVFTVAVNLFFHRIAHERGNAAASAWQNPEKRAYSCASADGADRALELPFVKAQGT